MGLSTGQALTFEDLRALVTAGTYEEKYTFTETSRTLAKKSEIEARLDIDPISGGTSNRAVRVEELDPTIIPIEEFDYLVARYMWDYPVAGRDLDIQVQFENNSTPSIDNIYVGFGGVNPTVPSGTVPETDAYLWWGLDDTNASANPQGIEGVLLGLKKFKDDFPSSPNIIEVSFYAVWYAIVATGNFTVEIATYKGGTMSKVGTNIVNTGGVQVSLDSRNVNTMIQNQLHTPANSYKVGILQYNKTTDTAVFILS